MSSDCAIKVENVGKCYPMYSHPRDRLKQFIVPRIQRALGGQARQYYREFWALKGVSFEVPRGETIGIVGRNGSGKSTLLQIICGTLNPTFGDVQTKGRIAALLELGSGFNPEFTGRENVYMNAAILGLERSEIDERFDDIVAFADIGEFIEHPVKTYSSGMMVRLAFAVQAQASPDILIVDEALAVGDAKFQAKCFDRLKQLKNNGSSILLVTHSTEQIVTHCSSAVLLEHGEMIKLGEPRDVVNSYLDLLFGRKQNTPSKPSKPVFQLSDKDSNRESSRPKLSHSDDIFATRLGYNPYEYRWGDGMAKIVDFHLTADESEYPTAIEVGQRIELRASVVFLETIVRPIFGITIKTKEGVTVYGANSNTLSLNGLDNHSNKGSSIEIRASFVCRLAPGDYFVSLGLASQQAEGVVPHDRRYDSIHLQVCPNPEFFGLADLELGLQIEEQQL
jgi:lipopolysaccharide transport system ATP-binding protein